MANILGFEARSSIEQQAREWLIRLDSEKSLSATETVALREWMARSPLHRQELTRLAKFWTQANVLTELAVPLEPEVRVDQTGRFGTWAAVAAAAGVVAAAALGWWLLRPLGGVTKGTYGTVIGQQKMIALHDGSTIELNTDSQVQVTFSDRLRSIRLLRGEALFSAAPDKTRPFVVYAGDSVVRAVGTAFSVRLEGSNIAVTVANGAVDVAEVKHDPPVADRQRPRSTTNPQTLGQLRAGETTTVASGTHHLEVHRLPQPELQRQMAWREGYLVFAGEPLREVIEQVNRYSPVTLEIGDAQLASIAIGGRFRVGDLDAVLDVLHTNFGIQAHQVDERNIRLEAERSR